MTQKERPPGFNFYPPPMISGATNMSGRDVWYDRRRLRLTVDPEDLFLSDRALIEKYGTAFDQEKKEDEE